MNYENKIKELKESLLKITPPPRSIGKKTAAEKAAEKECEERKARVQGEINLVKKYACLYSAIQVGDRVSITVKQDEEMVERRGVILDKLVNTGGIPQAWVRWDAAVLYPEYPMLPHSGWRFEVVSEVRKVA